MSGDSGRQERCAAELLQLLQGPYRQIWARCVDRSHGEQVSYSAVAKVLARTAALDRPDGVHHRELRDRVRRALVQGRLTNETLDLFVRAFAMRRADADRLWALLLLHPLPAPRRPSPGDARVPD